MDLTENEAAGCKAKFSKMKASHFCIIIVVAVVIFSLWIVFASINGNTIAVMLSFLPMIAFYTFAYKGCQYIICRTVKDTRPLEELEIQLQHQAIRDVMFTDYTDRLPSQQYTNRVINSNIDHDVMDDIHDVSMLDGDEHGNRANTADRYPPRPPNTRYIPPSEPTIHISPNNSDQNDWMLPPTNNRNIAPPPSYDEVMGGDNTANQPTNNAQGSTFTNEPPPPSYDSVT